MEALEKVDAALEVDRAADEARKALLDADQTGDRGAAKEARKRERSIRKQAKRAHREATKTARQAYDAIRFSEPGNMGLMRVVQVLFALHIGVTLLLLESAHDRAGRRPDILACAAWRCGDLVQCHHVGGADAGRQLASTGDHV